jgi:hypothetical protein
MEKTKRQVEILKEKPTHFIIKMIPGGQELKVGKSFFQKRLECGIFELVNAKGRATIAP